MRTVRQQCVVHTFIIRLLRERQRKTSITLYDWMGGFFFYCCYPGEASTRYRCFRSVFSTTFLSSPVIQLSGPITTTRQYIKTFVINRNDDGRTLFVIALVFYTFFIYGYLKPFTAKRPFQYWASKVIWRKLSNKW